MQDRVQNLDFAAGRPGEMPPGWRLGLQVGPDGTPDYAAQTAAAAACHSGPQCANLRSVGSGPHASSFLYQIVDATPYRGRWLAYHAAVRAAVTAPGVARLLVRIHRENGSTSVRDDMGRHPITSSAWAPYELDAPIPPDARDIEFGLQLYGEGSAFIDNISLTYTDPASAGTPGDADDVRDLIRKFSQARNAHDGPAAAALYSEDGEWLPPGGYGAVRGREALAKIWSTVAGQVERTIQSIEFPANNIAVVRVVTKFPDPVGHRHETFIVVKDGNGAWLIRVHQSLE